MFWSVIRTLLSGTHAINCVQYEILGIFLMSNSLVFFPNWENLHLFFHSWITGISFCITFYATVRKNLFEVDVLKSTGSIYFSPWLSCGTTTASRTFFTIYGGPQRREILFLWGIKIALNKNLPRSKLQKKRIRLHSISSEMLRSQFACKHLPRSHLQKKVVDFTAGARF